MPGIDPEAVHHMQLMRVMDALEENKDAVEQAVAKSAAAIAGSGPERGLL
jgi:hypothetical protein